MATSNTVTLTFAANTKPLQEGFKQVQTGAAETEAHLARAGQSAQGLGAQMESAGRSARNTREVFRGVGDVSVLMGGSVGQATQSLVLASGAFKDLSRGAGGLIEKYGLLRLGALGLVAALGAVAVSATSNQTGFANLGNDAARPLAAQFTHIDDIVQKMPNHLGFLGAVTDSVTNKFRGWAGQSETTRGALASLEDQAKATAAALAAAFQASLLRAPDTNPGGDAFFSSADAQDIATQVYRSQTPGYADVPKKSSSGGGSTLSAAMKADQQKAQATLSAWQSTLDKFRGISQGIQDALSPKLEAGDKGLMLFPGLSLLDKLKKQLADTLHLQRDIAALGKAGLNGDLLGSLVQGGLSSLPAADELLAGGKGEISAVNKTASGITKAGGTLAGNEAMRQLNAQKDVKVKIDVTGGENDLKKLIRKWVRVDGGGSVQLALGGK